MRRANFVKMSFLDARTGFEPAQERCWSLKVWMTTQNLFGQFLEETLNEDCKVPHERNIRHHVGSCLVLLSLQSTGDTNVSRRDPRNSARLDK